MFTRREFVSGSLAALAAAKLCAADSPPLMREVPASGERLPAIGLGTWQKFDVAPGQAGYAEAIETLQRFAQFGGRVVDSSPMYGLSSQALGEMARSSGFTADLFYASKLWTRGYAAGWQQLRNELQRFSVPKMDLMQVHNLSDVATQLQVLREARDQARVRLIGVSHYLSSAHAEVERMLRQEPMDVLQINYSIIEPEAEQRLLPLAQDHGVAVMVNRVFVEGALFRRVRGQALPGFVAALGVRSWAQYFLKWVLARPGVCVALVGTGNPDHVEDNLGALHGELPDPALRKRMADYLRQL